MDNWPKSSSGYKYGTKITESLEYIAVGNKFVPPEEDLHVSVEEELVHCRERYKKDECRGVR
jgi:hypothetical protein